MKVTGMELEVSKKGNVFLIVKTSKSTMPLASLKLSEGMPKELLKDLKAEMERRDELQKLAQEQKAKEDKINAEVQAEFKKLEEEKFKKLSKIRENIEKKVMGGK